MHFQVTKMLPWGFRRWVLFRKGVPAPQLYHFERQTDGEAESLPKTGTLHWEGEGRKTDASV